MNRVLPLVSLGLFVWSCFSNVFIFEEGNSSYLFGLICLLFGFGETSWYANPALLTAWILHSKKYYRLASGAGAVAIGLGLTAILIEEMPKDGAGNMTRVLGFHLGYYLWMSAHIVITLSGLYHWAKSKQAE